MNLDLIIVKNRSNGSEWREVIPVRMEWKATRESGRWYTRSHLWMLVAKNDTGTFDAGIWDGTSYVNFYSDVGFYSAGEDIYEPDPAFQIKSSNGGRLARTSHPPMKGTFMIYRPLNTTTENWLGDWVLK